MFWGLARFFGSVAVGAPPEPIPHVVESEDADLQLSPEELAEAEFATENWPFKELSAHLEGRYLSAGMFEDGARGALQDPRLLKLAAAGAERALRDGGKAAPPAEFGTGRTMKLPTDPTRPVKQDADTPHVTRIAGFLDKVKELKGDG